MNVPALRLATVVASVSLSALVAAAFASGAFADAPKTAVSRAPETRKTSQTVSEDAQALQVLNRLGYGPRPGDVERVRAMGISRYIDSQLNPASIEDSAVEGKLRSLPSLNLTLAQLANAYESDRARQRLRVAQKSAAQATAADGEMMKDTPGAAPAAPPVQNALLKKANEQRGEELIAEAERNGFKQGISNQIVGEMQTARLVRAVESKRQLQEVLVDFWSNHFNLDVKKGPVKTLRLADEREVIRPNVLGKFRDMLGASAKSPAMLFYLDNARSTRAVTPGENLNRNGRNRRRPNAAAQPKKTRGGINENYARELMELHTLGVNGGYTQKDVQEVARCFTGWSFVPKTGEFIFRPFGHDNESKVVLGKTIPAGGGIRDGERVLDILASHPSTAKHLSYKLCQRFVADSPPDALVQRGAQAYMQSGGDLKAMTRAILTSPEFMSGQYIGGKIKSPYEFVVSSVRAMDGSVVIPNFERPRDRLVLISNGQASAGRNTKAGVARNKTLPREMAEMGQPMFGCQPPTGYSEDSSNWVSAGALVSRLNFALALTGGSFVDVQTPSPRTASADAAGLVRSTALQLLSKELTPSTEATIRKQIEADATPDAKKVRALILGSPEFQRR